jgi:hypothetical protein
MSPQGKIETVKGLKVETRRSSPEKGYAHEFTRNTNYSSLYVMPIDG